MSKLNHLYNAEKYSVIKCIRNGGDNLLKVCPSIQWSLDQAIVLICKCRQWILTLLNVCLNVDRDSILPYLWSNAAKYEMTFLNCHVIIYSSSSMFFIQTKIFLKSEKHKNHLSNIEKDRFLPRFDFIQILFYLTMLSSRNWKLICCYFIQPRTQFFVYYTYLQMYNLTTLAKQVL